MCWTCCAPGSTAHRQDLFLLLVGSADSHDSCETEAREYMLTHEGEGKITGTVDNVSEYLRASDVFIFLSHFEGFSLSILEALATGLPSIVTNVGGARRRSFAITNGERWLMPKHLWRRLPVRSSGCCHAVTRGLPWHVLRVASS